MKQITLIELAMETTLNRQLKAKEMLAIVPESEKARKDYEEARELTRELRKMWKEIANEED